MNTLEFQIKLIPPESTEYISDLAFSGACIICPIIDGKNILFDDLWFDNGLLVWSELEKSTLSSGKFLLFTTVIGVADEGGWDYVIVKHTDTTVEWFLDRDSKRSYSFDKQAYTKAVKILGESLSNISKEYILEPKFVLEPE
jgi:hypothetical protein